MNNPTLIRNSDGSVNLTKSNGETLNLKTGDKIKWSQSQRPSFTAENQVIQPPAIPQGPSTIEITKSDPIKIILISPKVGSIGHRDYDELDSIEIYTTKGGRRKSRRKARKSRKNKKTRSK